MSTQLEKAFDEYMEAEGQFLQKASGAMIHRLTFNRCLKKSFAAGVEYAAQRNIEIIKELKEGL